MTISKLATEQWPLGKTANGQNRFYKRPSNPKGFIVHHAAGTSDAGLKSQYVARHRVLSSNYAMKQNGDIVSILHEEYRPFTSSSAAADNWGITIEIVNSTGAPGWKISDRAFDQLARLIADCSKRWGFPINRSTVIGHREVITRFRQGIATACPGPYLYPKMDELVALANKYRNGSVTPPPAPSSPAPAAPAPSSKSAGGANVAELQKWLNRMYPSYSKLNVNGVYDKATEAVIYEWQKRVKSTGAPDGNIGPKTKAELQKAGFKAWGTSTPAPDPAPKPAQRAWPLDRTVKLAAGRSGYNTAADAKARRPVLRTVPKGTYQVTGYSQGQFKINYGRNGIWISDAVKAYVSK